MGEIVGKLHRVANARRRAKNVAFLDGGIRSRQGLEMGVRAEIPPKSEEEKIKHAITGSIFMGMKVEFSPSWWTGS